MKITVRRDTWTASAAAVAAAAAAIQAVVGARPSGSVGPRSDRSKRWQPALPARWRGGRGGSARGGSVAARVVLRDPGLPGSAGGSPGGNTRTILWSPREISGHSLTRPPATLAERRATCPASCSTLPTISAFSLSLSLSLSLSSLFLSLVQLSFLFLL